MQADDLIPLWQDLVRDAAARGEHIRIHGGNSKAPWMPAVQHSGAETAEHTLDTTQLAGITHYEPTELVITARAGTPLAEIEAALAAHQQFLPFEPPHFARFGASTATVGGMVACGLSGPARMSVGAVRDYVLGASLLNGRGEVLHFGGEVMKNVAGFDVSRLLCGSLGSLGVILSVSLKVQPLPAAQATLRFAMTQDEAITRCNTWAAQPLPINASAWLPDRNTGKGVLTLRLRGAQAAVQAACARLGGQRLDDAEAAVFWQALREQTLPWFASTWPGDSQAALWRLSLPGTAPTLDLSGTQLVEWYGAQRWLISAAPAPIIQEAARQAGGHATRFRGGDSAAEVFCTLPAPLDRIARNVKAAFDPHGVFPTLF